jgi:hypothetical protein
VARIQIVSALSLGGRSITLIATDASRRSKVTVVMTLRGFVFVQPNLSLLVHLQRQKILELYAGKSMIVEER